MCGNINCLLCLSFWLFVVLLPVPFFEAILLKFKINLVCLHLCSPLLFSHSVPLSPHLLSLSLPCFHRSLSPVLTSWRFSSPLSSYPVLSIPLSLPPLVYPLISLSPYSLLFTYPLSSPPISSPLLSSPLLFYPILSIMYLLVYFILMCLPLLHMFIYGSLLVAWLIITAVIITYRHNCVMVNMTEWSPQRNAVSIVNVTEA